ncbi:hydrogenase maturation protease [Methanogenium organophilum]|uniref:Hydrogenase maturation protease n=1 Tax=Methanogenium organophilum TaxID=2199 RepID=A0A9X9S525_METOG|nr:hydrogenase maturation protease [Methanogenium organophilum]WAI01055.1 hydrogenase maturation protease [Methanogenium organophilum]
MTNKRVRVIGCGNPLMGNDAVGVRVIENLQKTHPEIDVIEGGVGGLGMLPMMEGYDHIFLVDATTGYGSHIGEILIFSKPPSNEFFPLSLSDIGVLDAVNVAEELGICPEITIIGIEAGKIEEFSACMSPEMETAVEDACVIILNEIKKE